MRRRKPKALSAENRKKHEELKKILARHKVEDARKKKRATRLKSKEYREFKKREKSQMRQRRR